MALQPSMSSWRSSTLPAWAAYLARSVAIASSVSVSGVSTVPERCDGALDVARARDGAHVTRFSGALGVNARKQRGLPGVARDLMSPS